MDEAARAEVDDFDFASGIRFNQDVFWFQVTMNELQIVDVAESCEYLLCDYL